MTTMTTSTTGLGEHGAYHAGKADAWDEHQAGTPLDVLAIRLDALLDHLAGPDALAYTLGYSATYVSAKLQEEASVAATEELAYEERAAALRADAADDLAAYHRSGPHRAAPC